LSPTDELSARANAAGMVRAESDRSIRRGVADRLRRARVSRIRGAELSKVVSPEAGHASVARDRAGVKLPALDCDVAGADENGCVARSDGSDAELSVVVLSPAPQSRVVLNAAAVSLACTDGHPVARHLHRRSEGRRS